MLQLKVVADKCILKRCAVRTFILGEKVGKGPNIFFAAAMELELD